MAVKNIATTDTLETFRTTFNDLCANDFGDKANLSGSITATNLVDAMNETISIATSTAGFTIEDSSSTTQLIGGGETFRILGTSNEIEAVVSATDTLTIGLPNAVTVTTSLTSPIITGGSIQITGNTITATDSTAISFASENLITSGTINAGAITGTSITGSGATHTLGTVEISGNTIRSTDSTRLNVNDTLSATSLIGGDIQLIDVSGRGTLKSASGSNQVLNFDCWPVFNSNISFEGATDDDFETDVVCTDPTADRTITIPDNTGTIITTGSTDAVSEAMMANDAIGSNELKTVTSLVIYNSSGTPLKTIYGAGA